jgi:hypothetical protein
MKCRSSSDPPSVPIQSRLLLRESWQSHNLPLITIDRRALCFESTCGGNGSDLDHLHLAADQCSLFRDEHKKRFFDVFEEKLTQRINQQLFTSGISSYIDIHRLGVLPRGKF